MNASSRRSPRTFLVAAALFLAVPSIAFAQPPCAAADWDRAVEHARKARGLADSKETQAALVELGIAFGICPDGKLQRAMARVLEDSGRLPEALDAYRACVQAASEAETRASCEQRVQALAATLSTGTMLVEVSPPGAEVFVDDGVAAHPAGTPVVLGVGRHQVEVRAAGRQAYRREIDVLPAKEVRFAVVLEVQPQPKVAEIPVQVPASPPVASPNVARPAGQRSAVSNWVGIGVGTAVTGVGLAFLIQYGIDKSNARGAQYSPDGRLLADADKVGSRNVIVGSVLSVAGVAGVINSAVLWPKAPAKISIGPLHGGGAIAVQIPL